jgi:hypothetical protein
VIKRVSFAEADLPNQLVLRVDSGTLRVVARAGALSGWARITATPGAQVDAPLVLSRATGDADADRVPDAVDDCPLVADPDQQGSCAGADMGALPSLCAGSGLQLCDPFEGPTLDNAVWAVDQPLAEAATFDSVTLRRGTHALRLDPQGMNQGSYRYRFAESATFPSSSYYLRMFVMLGPSGDTLGLKLFDTYNAQNQVFLSLDDYGRPGLLTDYPVVGGTDNQRTSATRMMRAQWICLEVSITRGGGNTNVRLSLDDKPLSDVELQLAVDMVALDTVKLGVEVYNATMRTPPTVWLDELAIDSQPIGCSR